MSVSFLKRGAAAVQAAEQNKQRVDLRKEEMGKMFRFYLLPGEEARITFVDGELDENGYFNPVRGYEHKVFRTGEKFPHYYLCPKLNNPQSGMECPICSGGDFPSFNAFLTIVDHTAHASKKTPGKIIQNQRRLFVAPSGFMDKILIKLAQKLGGLQGQTFDVSRGESEKSSRVGDLYVPIERKPLEELQKMYVEPVTDKQGKPTGQMQTVFTPAEYDKETVALNAEQLMQLGFGAPAPGQTPYKAPASSLGIKPGGNTPPAEEAETEEEMF